MVAAIVALDRRQLARAVAVEVGLDDQASAGPARRDDRSSDRAAVKARGAALGDSPEGARKVLLDEPSPGPERLARVEEDRARGGILAEVGIGQGKHVDIALIEGETVLGEGDGRGDQRGARHRPVRLTRHLQAGDGARHADGESALGAQALDDVTVLVEVHAAGGGERRLLAEIQEGAAPVGELDGHEAAAAEVARGGVDHRQRIADRDRSIDGVAAALQDVDADLRREVLGGDHHAVLGDRGRHRRGTDRRRCKRDRQDREQRHGDAPWSATRARSRHRCDPFVWCTQAHGLSDVRGCGRRRGRSRQGSGMPGAASTGRRRIRRRADRPVARPVPDRDRVAWPRSRFEAGRTRPAFGRRPGWPRTGATC